MKNILYILFLIIPAVSAGQTLLPENYNVVWNSQSTNSSESMPCGGGDIGLNVWVENGDLLFYMARSGTFDENNTMPKLGRVRIQCDPNPFVGATFRQELQLEKGSVLISAEKEGTKTQFEIWVDVFNPIIHVEVESDKAIDFQASYESWRYEDRKLRKFESFQNSYKWALSEGLLTRKDEIYFDGDAVLFYHRNQGETIFDATVNQQKLNSVKDSLFNPLEKLTFGGLMWGENLVQGETSEGKYQQTAFKSWRLKSKKAAKKYHLKIALNTGQFDGVDEWKAELENRIQKENKQKSTRKLTLDWWRDYWQRSFVLIQPENTDYSNPSWQAGRNYQLFRYMLGCNAYGKYPTKFNGGLFTVDPIFTNDERPFTPDFRNWGGGTFTAQNQRLIYFPMLASGDFDMMKPQLDFYLRILRNAELRSRCYWDHDGACFTEQIENFGLPNPSEYGWKRPENYDPGMMYNAWLEYQWDTSLEICWMVLQLNKYQRADISDYLPLIESCLTFFDEHYQYLAKQRGTKALDENGDLILYPGSACETYKMAYNATSTVVALYKVTEGLLQLAEYYPQEIDSEKWQAFLERIPPFAFRQFGDKVTIAPAKLWERINNTEAPQLYPVYPWGIYGVGKPGLDIAQNTYLYDQDIIKFQDHQSWKQYNIFAARLGLTEEAVKYTLLKMKDSGRRFPAFWGPGFDWVPDHNWGGSGMIGVQEMLLQTNGDKIYLFPAWPKEWNVHFKLHAPGNTSVEAELKDGMVNIIDVQPETRKTDIEILLKQN
ncbi:DUF5703 domain-containing protein [Maribellus sediminis]|uniref:DUF5703 domain-containing protein n=1 Tax=Maribellus sediminis TaxID=2696285 RepID=UPI00142FB1A4|nr:DUF5703 domain-containing protein [Maribellus sediminis]